MRIWKRSNYNSRELGRKPPRSGGAGETLGDADLSSLYDLYAGKELLDAELGIPVRNAVTLSFGAQNLLNSYPEENPLAADGTGNL